MSNTKYWTICYPGEFGQLIRETFSESQILLSYYDYWSNQMIRVDKSELISEKRCIDDWIVVHWATPTDEFGEKLND